MEYYILAMIDDNSLKTQDIRLKLDSFDSIRLTLEVSIKNICLSLKNNFYFRRNFDMEYDWLC